MDKLTELKLVWDLQYNYIIYTPTDEEFTQFLDHAHGNVKQAADLLSDYVLSQGLAEEVVE